MEIPTTVLFCKVFPVIWEWLELPMTMPSSQAVKVLFKSRVLRESLT